MKPRNKRDFFNVLLIAQSFVNGIRIKKKDK